MEHVLKWAWSRCFSWVTVRRGLVPTAAGTTAPSERFGGYALRTIESFGFDEQGRSRIKYVEVWNEPNIEQFWTGTQQEYFSCLTHCQGNPPTLPGVMEGQLVSQGNMEQWLVDFIATGQERILFRITRMARLESW